MGRNNVYSQLLFKFYIDTDIKDNAESINSMQVNFLHSILTLIYEQFIVLVYWTKSLVGFRFVLCMTSLSGP